MLIENFETWLGTSKVTAPNMEADERLRACWDNAFEAGRSYGINEGKDIALEEAEEKYYDYEELKSLKDDITSTGEDPDELIAFYDEWHEKAERIDLILDCLKLKMRLYTGDKLVAEILDWVEDVKEDLCDEQDS